jgi:16S rRNA (guanine966-N2)-methyltransferase
MIRVVSGKYRGKKLKRVPGTGTRPIPHKLKEAFFSVIHFDLPGVAMLDGFAGTGSIGIEALSRGAERVVFVEQNYRAVKVIQHNLEKCGAMDRAAVVHKEFNRAVIKLAKEKEKFHMIFVDPPYAMLEERDPLKVIYKRGILREGGLIALRKHFKTQYDNKYFAMQRKIRAGDDVILFYKAGKDNA